MKTPLKILIVLVLLNGKVLASDLLEPHPDLSPSDVVAIQLTALKNNDQPTDDFGIVQTWAFAHPDNKAVTGPLERFAAMIRSPGYGILINHLEHKIQPVVMSDDYAMLTVTILTTAGQHVAYRWELRKVEDGNLKGAWMTTSVSAPMQVQDGT